jgi:hypothetical protein
MLGKAAAMLVALSAGITPQLGAYSLSLTFDQVRALAGTPVAIFRSYSFLGWYYVVNRIVLNRLVSEVVIHCMSIGSAG